MATKSIHVIMAEASEEQIMRWWPLIRDDVWPSDMPVPMEAFSDVWNPIQRRVSAIENKPAKKKEADS